MKLTLQAKNMLEVQQGCVELVKHRAKQKRDLAETCVRKRLKAEYLAAADALDELAKDMAEVTLEVTS